jgi:cation/acetate symporter
VLGHSSSIFPLKNPALISMPAAFVVGFVVSLMTRDRTAEDRFYEAERRVLLGAPATVPMEPVVARRRPTG